MPSPFPGMDPYLEDPSLWPDFHHEVISNTRAALNAQLGPRYQVRIEERVYISDRADSGRSEIVPDLRVVRRPASAGRALIEGGGGTLEIAEPVVVTTLIDDEIHEARIEVVDRVSRDVLTVIEVVSPTNKVPGARGQGSFRVKRNEILNSSSHWVEIDLLRRGIRVTVEEPLPACEYLVHVSKVETRPRGFLGPIRLSQRLPAISVPLGPDDPDAPLDLQAVLDVSYGRAGYDLDIDYTKEPAPPLEGDWAAWADRLLKERGLRPGSV